ncbi:MAG: hypothetical protein K5799_12555 [Erythrobacter sp.]|nr:hypothetical protein [Erythrobacter sp.]
MNLLDVFDGDPDVELNGDETDHDRAEDCFTIGKNDHANGPGCPIADPDCCEDADRGEETAAEDSFRYHGGIGPGCALADGGIADDGGVQDVNLRDRELVRVYHRKHS